MIKRYLLDSEKRVYEVDLDGESSALRVAKILEWYREFLRCQIVRVSLLGGGRLRLGTVFLGLDHRCGLDGPPVVFETMAFKEDVPKDDDSQASEMFHRCATYAEAVAFHEQTLARLAPEWGEAEDVSERVQARIAKERP